MILFWFLNNYSETNIFVYQKIKFHNDLVQKGSWRKISHGVLIFVLTRHWHTEKYYTCTKFPGKVPLFLKIQLDLDVSCLKNISITFNFP